MKIRREGENAPGLAQSAADIARLCTECGKCSRDCLFLQQYGLPGQQAAAVIQGDFSFDHAFLCSLCGLCTEVCPLDIDPAAMFLDLRKQAGLKGEGDFRCHRNLVTYERLGTSSFLTWYGLPSGCHTVFFPGCALPGTRPQRVIALFHELSSHIPGLGLVLDCCTKPSHDLGRHQYFTDTFGRLVKTLLDKGVGKVVVACPNCYRMFAIYGTGLAVTTVYEELAETFCWQKRFSGTVTVHDPCGLRNEQQIHHAVRTLVRGSGLEVEEMAHCQGNTLCCGEGGGVGYMDNHLSDNWIALRRQEAGGRLIVAYCAGCSNYLGRQTPTIHLVDLLFAPRRTLQGRMRGSRSPKTYLNRILLKRKLKGIVDG